jgi:hypothetical protein
VKAVFPADDGLVTSRFDEARGGHVHGALDIMGPVGTPWRALKDGEAMWHQILLVSKDRNIYNNWGNIRWMNGSSYPFANYSVEFYGVCCVLVCEGHREMYLYAHGNPDLMGPFFTARPTRFFYSKKSNDEYIISMWTEPCKMQQGDCVGYMGFAGQTMPTPFESHLHIEGHPGTTWAKHENRIRMEDILGL